VIQRLGANQASASPDVKGKYYHASRPPTSTTHVDHPRRLEKQLRNPQRSARHPHKHAVNHAPVQVPFSIDNGNSEFAKVRHLGSDRRTTLGELAQTVRRRPTRRLGNVLE